MDAIDQAPAEVTTAPARGPAPQGAGRLRVWWQAAFGAIGTVVGLAPLVLHHVGLLAGTALVAGTGGTLAFATLGLVATVPVLLRLRRRFGSWWAPPIGLAVFAVMFSVSTFVIGPAINADPGQAPCRDAQPTRGSHRAPQLTRRPSGAKVPGLLPVADEGHHAGLGVVDVVAVHHPQARIVGVEDDRQRLSR